MLRLSHYHTEHSNRTENEKYIYFFCIVTQREIEWDGERQGVCVCKDVKQWGMDKCFLPLESSQPSSSQLREREKEKGGGGG